MMAGKVTSKAVASKVLITHGVVILGLFLLQFVLPEYHHLTVTRIMILATFAMGYNVLFGYTGLLSLGHAMFFGVGLFTAGLTVYHWGWNLPAAFFGGIVAGALLSFLVGCVALRTTGVAFMIVTLMFSQVAYLTTLYFTKYTRGDEGLVLPANARSFDLFGWYIDLTNPTARYNLSLLILVVVMIVIYRLVTGKTGRSLVAVREKRTSGANAWLQHIRHQANGPGGIRHNLRYCGSNLCIVVCLCRVVIHHYSILHRRIALYTVGWPWHASGPDTGRFYDVLSHRYYQ